MISVRLEQVVGRVDLERVVAFPAVPRRGDLIEIPASAVSGQVQPEPRIVGTVSHVRWVGTGRGAAVDVAVVVTLFTVGDGQAGR